MKIRFPRERKSIMKERNLSLGVLREIFCCMHFILLQNAIVSSTPSGKKRPTENVNIPFS